MNGHGIIGEVIDDHGHEIDVGSTPGMVHLIVGHSGGELLVRLSGDRLSEFGRLLTEANRNANGETTISYPVRPIVFDLATPDLAWVLKEALDTWAAAQREQARVDGNAQRDGWAALADQARAQVEATP